VLVHGTPSRALVWREVAAALERDHTVYTFDLLGFGESERHVDQDVSLRAHGEVLAELVSQWGLGSPALVGHDIGGAVGLRAHLLEGVRVSRLALVDAVVLRPWITPRTRDMQRRSWDSFPDESLGKQIEEHLRTATSRELDPDIYDAIFGQWSGEEGQRLYVRNFMQLDEQHTAEFEPKLGTIDVPVLVVWGEEDAWLPVSVSERLAAVIPGARRVLLAEAGHFSMEDAPGEVAAALAGFLR
jgi:pimeloyl-ACP methyl ester carboxylesterase